jgi:hypothetical protein
VIRALDTRARRLASLLRHESVTRHMLVRANPLTCTVHVPGRSSVALTCPTCNGTGYTNGLRTDLPLLSTLGAPYNTLFFVKGEIQMGHGLRGAGGYSAFTDGDRGTEFLGDAVFYFPAMQRDPSTGAYVMPMVGSTPRPDRLVRGVDGQVFTVLHDLDESYGTSPLFRAMALGIGTQGSGEAGVPG